MRDSRVLIPVTVFLLLLVPSLASAEGTVTILEAEVEGFTVHVEWVTDTPIGYFLIYLNGQLVGYKPVWDINGNVYVFEYPAIMYYTYVVVEQYDSAGHLIGSDFAYID